MAQSDVAILVLVFLVELQGNSCPDTQEPKLNTGLPFQDSILHLSVPLVSPILETPLRSNQL